VGDGEDEGVLSIPTSKLLPPASCLLPKP